MYLKHSFYDCSYVLRVYLNAVNHCFCNCCASFLFYNLFIFYSLSSVQFCSISTVYCVVCSPFKVKYLTPFYCYLPLVHPPFHLVTTKPLSVSVCFCLSCLLHLVLFPRYKWNCVVLNFFQFISIRIIILRCIHAVKNGSISSFLITE